MRSPTPILERDAHRREPHARRATWRSSPSRSPRLPRPYPRYSQKGRLQPHKLPPHRRLWIDQPVAAETGFTEAAGVASRRASAASAGSCRGARGRNGSARTRRARSAQLGFHAYEPQALRERASWRTRDLQGHQAHRAVGFRPDSGSPPRDRFEGLKASRDPSPSSLRLPRVRKLG